MTTASQLDVGKRVGRAAPVLPETGTTAQALVRTLRARPLPEEFVPWVEEYEQIGHHGRFLWHWCFEGASLTTLPCVDAELCERNLVTKVLGVTWDVMLDDVADREQDAALLEQLVASCGDRQPWQRALLPRTKRRYVEFTTRLWDTVHLRAQTYPRYNEFAEILHFDYQQLVNALRYAVLINRDIQVLNLTEHDLYLAHNMHIMVSGTLDLMCSPTFDRGELGFMREVLWHAECMGRIGNLLSTWERELADGDVSSGVFAWALRNGVFRRKDLREKDRSALAEQIRQTDCERFFLRQWRDHRHGIDALCESIASVDVRAYLRGMERLLEMEFNSRGLK